MYNQVGDDLCSLFECKVDAMISGNRQYRRLSLLLVWITLCATLTGAAGLRPHSQHLPELQITSPADHAIFNPGQAIPIIVASPAGLSFKAVGVVGETILGLSNIAISVPAKFSLTIPKNSASGEYALTADGITSSGQSFSSKPVLVDVEYSGPALGLSTSLPGIFFLAKGERASVSFVATFDVGVEADVTASTMMSYLSSDTNVATVDASSGRLIVTAVGPGNTTVTATYGQGATSIPLSIPVTNSRQL
jgi:hypothetical protein